MSGISHLCHEHSPDCIRLTAKFPEVMSARMKRSSQLIGWAIAVVSGLISLANAQTFSSSYTSTAPKDCRTIGKPSDLDGSATQVCPGRSGLVVLISEGDLRETVSVGRNREAAAKEPAAQAWFGPFNSTTHTVEWRAVGGKPSAIIKRWRLAYNTDEDMDDWPTAKPLIAL